jgi:hypothetical protein
MAHEPRLELQRAAGAEGEPTGNLAAALPVSVAGYICATSAEHFIHRTVETKRLSNRKGEDYEP